MPTVPYSANPRTEVCASDRLPVNEPIGPYVVERLLGEGGMAQVFVARRGSASGGSTEPVAIKKMLPHLAWDPDFVRMFLEEVRILTRLEHPNIVGVIDYGTSESGYYLVMEYVQGQSLNRIMRALRGAKMPLEVALGVVLDIARGVGYAHQFTEADGSLRPIVHRDLSPSNVMLEYGGTAKLLDFGIAMVEGASRYTKAGTIKGKAGYMSPEQCRGEAVDQRTDVFGLGVLLYEMAVGRRAFHGGSAFETMAKALQGMYVAPRMLDPTFPADLEAIIRRALAVDQNHRYQSVGQMVADLRACGSHLELDVGPGPRARFLKELIPEEFPPSDSGTDVSVSGLSAMTAAATRVMPPRAKTRLRVQKPLPMVAVGLAAAVAVLGGIGVRAELPGSTDPAPSKVLPARRTAPERIERTVPATNDATQESHAHVGQSSPAPEVRRLSAGEAPLERGEDRETEEGTQALLRSPADETEEVLEGSRRSLHSGRQRPRRRGRPGSSAPKRLPAKPAPLESSPATETELSPSDEQELPELSRPMLVDSESLSESATIPAENTEPTSPAFPAEEEASQPEDGGKQVNSLLPPSLRK